MSTSYQDNNNAARPNSGHHLLLPDSSGAYNPTQSFHGGVSLHRDDVEKSLSSPHIHTALVQTLLGLLYSLSNQCLDYTGREILDSIIKSSGWDMVLPHLRDMLNRIDPRVVDAIAEGLFKESIRNCHYRMLELSLGLGADPTQRLTYSHRPRMRHIIISTPLVALCSRHRKTSRPGEGARNPSPEKLIVSLLKRDSHVSNSTLLWIIRASCHAIAERVIRNQPERAIDFAVTVSELEDGSWLGFNTYNLVTPLLVACSDTRQSDEKLSLVRCLLERNAKADLEAMIAAAAASDAQVISLLHQHGAPVNGFIPELGTPLSSACSAALAFCEADLTAIQVLLGLGASPNDPDSRELNEWVHSPLHILAMTDDRPAVTEALGLLFQHGVDINYHANLYEVFYFRGQDIDMPILWHYGEEAETALEYAIIGSHWTSAFQLLSACCELTGREILFLYTRERGERRLPLKERQAGFRQFVWSLLAKAHWQKDALHWNGCTVLQCAIQSEDEDVILALFAFGVTPTSIDFTHMLSNRKCDSATVCRLSSNIQMKLAVTASSSGSPVTCTAMVRLILAFACPAVVRFVLEGCSDVYDSAGLCYIIARVVSSDNISYYEEIWVDDDHDLQRADCLNLQDIRMFVSRRAISNRHEDWESTAVCIAARAGRVDILHLLIGFDYGDAQGIGFVPTFILKLALVGDRDPETPSEEFLDERNTRCIGIWIEYCRMDEPKMRCSPLTAAAMVEPETAGEEVVNLLLAQKYHPDGWTVLLASCRGYIKILQRLKRLESWPHILNHKDRPDWCPTALQIAVYHGHVNMVKFLLDTGAMMDTMDLCQSRPSRAVLPCIGPRGSNIIMPRTALQHAVESGNMELVTLLVDAGADVNAPAAVDSGATALQIASIQGSIPMVQYLLRLNADVHAEGAARHGRTALQGAAEHGRKDVVELLLEHIAPTASQHRERIVEALFYAEKNEQHVVARVLRQSLSPPWSSEDRDTLEILEEDWESSSEISLSSEVKELEMQVRDWEETFEDLPDSSREPWANESESTSDVGSEELHTGHPSALQEDDSSLPKEMEWSVEDLGGFDFRRDSEIDSCSVDISQWLTFPEDDTTCLDFPTSFEEVGEDQALFDNFP